MASLPSQMWLVAMDGQPQGPFSTDQVLDDIRSGRITVSTLICPTAGGTWALPGTFAVFASVCPPPLRTLPGGKVSEIFLSVAGWYELVGVACFKVWVWVLLPKSESDFLEGTSAYQIVWFVDVVSEVLLLIMMVIGCIAGVKLLQRRQEAVAWTICTIVGQWMLGLAALTLTVLIHTSAPSEAFRSKPDMSPQEVVQLLVAVVSLLLGCAFEVVAAVWLWCLRPFLSNCSTI